MGFYSGYVVKVRTASSPARELGLSNTPSEDSAYQFEKSFRLRGCALSQPGRLVGHTSIDRSRLSPDSCALRVRAWLSMTPGVRFSWQISHLVKRANLDFARSRHGIRTALYPRDRLVHILDVPDPEAGYQLVSFSEWAVDHPAAWAIECDALGLRGRLQALGHEQQAGIAQIVVELAHRLHHLGRPFLRSGLLFTVFSGFYEHDDAHACLLIRAGSPLP